MLLQKRDDIAKKIDKYLEIDDFQFDINYLMAIHKYLFKGVIPFAGNFRECNLTRKEKVLNNESLIYSDYKRIYLCLEYDFDNERKKNYVGISSEELVKSIADFTFKIWQVHPFRDGNTRTVSVFVQKYLKSMGYCVDNNIFKENGIYFRNALVIAGYYNYELGVHRNMEYIMKFYKKLLIDKTIELVCEEVYVKELFYRNSNHKKILKK